MSTRSVRNMDAFMEMLDDLERDHRGKWVVIHNGELAGIYETDKAAVNATAGFQTPGLVRQICPPLTVFYIPTPVFNDDCLDEDGYPDLDKWAQQPEPAMFYRPRLSYPKGYWDDAND